MLRDNIQDSSDRIAEIRGVSWAPSFSAGAAMDRFSVEWSTRCLFESTSSNTRQFLTSAILSQVDHEIKQFMNTFHFPPEGKMGLILPGTVSRSVWRWAAFQSSDVDELCWKEEEVL